MNVPEAIRLSFGFRWESATSRYLFRFPETLQMKMETYDLRPVICLDQFPETEKDKIASEILDRTQRKYDDFQWYLDGLPQGKVTTTYWTIHD